jgi:hypothetical protein
MSDNKVLDAISVAKAAETTVQIAENLHRIARAEFDSACANADANYPAAWEALQDARKRLAEAFAAQDASNAEVERILD